MSKHGVLLAISSLPGKYGIGDFSSEAFEFINILKKNKVNLWQILPLNPLGYGHSPYQSFSSYAFDEIYICIEDLQARKLLGKVKKVPSRCRTNYELSRKIKEDAIWRAYDKFKQSPNNIKKLNKFLLDNPYISEYSEFITKKEFNDQRPWNEWCPIDSSRQYDFDYAREKHAFAQMILYEQWEKIKKYANKNGIEIIGDVPFYVGYDSCDVYFHKESFMLDRDNKPSCIAGVPPDYFSETGQRWGNPIWNWDYLYEHDFKAMMDRIFMASKLFDIVRIDHFRAFDSYWSINPSCPTAVDGEWKYPDGYLFFRRLFEKYPKINIIVEDLGELRPEVLVLRDYFKLSGMREVEFHIYDDELLNKRCEIANQTYYVSTHDNETLVQWIKNQDSKRIKQLKLKLDELNIKGTKLNERLIHYALKRKENIVIVPISDILGLGQKYRMNQPGTINDDNWKFKLKDFNKVSLAIKKFF